MSKWIGHISIYPSNSDSIVAKYNGVVYANTPKDAARKIFSSISNDYTILHGATCPRDTVRRIARLLVQNAEKCENWEGNRWRIDLEEATGFFFER